MELQLIQNKIYEIREHKVMLDFDLAEIYQVETKVLKQAVRRNIDRFPNDFMFELTKKESDFLRSQIVTLENCFEIDKRGKHSKYLPFAFTEQGFAMLSSVLRSDVAIKLNISIMRAFIAIRKELILSINSKTLEERIKALEEANEELLKDINDLSEDTRKYLDDLFNAFAQLSNQIKVSKNKSSLNQIGYTAEIYKNKS